MEPGDARLMVDPLQQSEAWRRLQDPLSVDAGEDLRRFKHDAVTVFTSMLMGISSQQGMIVELHAAVTAMTTAHGDLKQRLFDSDTGQFVSLRKYVDDRVDEARERSRASVKAARDDQEKDSKDLRALIERSKTRATAAAWSFGMAVVLLSLDVALRSTGHGGP